MLVQGPDGYSLDGERKPQERPWQRGAVGHLARLRTALEVVEANQVKSIFPDEVMSDGLRETRMLDDWMTNC